jgi:ABC-type transport system involved in cytochrome bd biosynthesis fused ATPase/permease subunit
VELAVGSGVTLGLKAAAQLVPLCLALILLSSRLAVVGILALLPFAVSLAGLRRWWRRGVVRSQALRDELQVDLDDLVRNLDLWRCYGAGEQLERALARTSTRAGRATAKTEAGRAALSGLNEVLAVLALLGCVALAPTLGIAALDGRLLGFAAVFFLSYRPLRDLGDARAWVARRTVALEAIASLSTPEPAPKSPRPKRSYEGAPEELTLTGVGARDFGPRTSLMATPGTITAVVGPTGSGKSTLLRVLLGLERPVGSILYGDHDLTPRGIGPEERPFAWVPQHAPLVDDTLLGNITLCGCSKADALEALKLVGAQRLTGLVDEAVGPSGRQLSGGERRLVSVARAVATKLPVLLLDEPTEGLDDAAQGDMIDALSRLRRKRTLLVVTHHERVKKVADRVVWVGAKHDEPQAAE